ncbi:MAG: hypothetical protein ACE5EN_10550 [Nitrospinota bacterium]
MMIRQFPVNRAIGLFAPFAAGALLAALLLPASEPDPKAKSYEARIRSLEAGIAARDKTLGEAARRERELSLRMKSANLNSAALETEAEVLSQKTARAQSRLVESKKRGDENEPIPADNPDDSDLVNRLDHLLAGIRLGKGKTG